MSTAGLICWCTPRRQRPTTKRVAATPIAMRDNVIAAQNLAAWVADGRVGAVLMLSSLSVYGAVDGDTVTPDSPINGPGLYGANQGIRRMRSGWERLQRASDRRALAWGHWASDPAQLVARRAGCGPARKW